MAHNVKKIFAEFVLENQNRWHTVLKDSRRVRTKKPNSWHMLLKDFLGALREN